MVPIESGEQQALRLPSPTRWRCLCLSGLIVVVAGLGLGLWLSLWALRPDLLHQHIYYDFIHRPCTDLALVIPPWRIFFFWGEFTWWV
jgi:hypothetical protein